MSGLAGHNHSRPAPATEVGRNVVNLPNLVTMARLGTVPAVLWLAAQNHLAAAFVLFSLSALSDAVDGWLARRYGATALGAMLDPLADKLLLVGMFVVLAAIGLVPVWLAVLAITRDVLIVAGLGVLWFRSGAVRMGPSTVSKVNTALQLLLVAATLLVHGFAVPGGLALAVLTGVVAATTLLSAAAYVRQVMR